MLKLLNLASRAAGIIFALLNMYLLTRYVSISTQGAYYSIFGILATQVFVEMGRGYSIVQIFSHEMANCDIRNGELNASLKTIRKMSNIIVDAIRLYLRNGAIFVIASTLIGHNLLNLSAENSIVLLCSATLVLLGLIIQLCMAVTEGFCSVKRAIVNKAVWVVSTNLGTCVGLVLGAELWCLPIGLLVGCIISTIALRMSPESKIIEMLISHRVRDENLNDIKKFQNKIGLSWVVGFVGIQLMVPLSYRLISAEAAAQFGLAFQLFIALNGSAILLVISNISQHGRRIALGEIEVVKKIYVTDVVHSLLFWIIGFVCLIVAYLQGVNYLPHIQERLLEPNQFIVLGIGCFFMYLQNCMAYYYRMFKVELYSGVSLFFSGSILIGCSFSAHYFGLDGMLIDFMVISFLVNFLYSFKKFNKHKSQLNI